MDIVPEAKANIILDASKIDLFETCPARYDMRHNKNKTLPILHKAKALDTGSLAHAGFEVYFNKLSEGIHFSDRMEAAMMKIREKASDPNESNSEPEEVNHLLRVFEECCDYWRAEDENCIEVLAVEQPFLYTLYEDDDLRIMCSGKIDLFCNYNGLGRSSDYKGLPIDHKTFSRDSLLLRKSNQFENYAYAVGSNYLIVNRMGLHSYESRKPIEASERFKRMPLSYDPIYLARWKDNLTKMLVNEYIGCISADYWPEKPTSCNKFNRLCEYYAVCDSPTEEDKARKLETEYIDGEPWDVTKEMDKS